MWLQTETPLNFGHYLLNFQQLRLKINSSLHDQLNLRTSVPPVWANCRVRRSTTQHERSRLTVAKFHYLHRRLTSKRLFICLFATGNMLKTNWLSSWASEQNTGRWYTPTDCSQHLAPPLGAAVQYLTLNLECRVAIGLTAIFFAMTQLWFPEPPSLGRWSRLVINDGNIKENHAFANASWMIDRKTEKRLEQRHETQHFPNPLTHHKKL